MTMHRLTAGAGYRYLLRHVASGDCARSAGTPLSAYYVQSGTPPGRWLGSGVAGLGAVALAQPAVVAAGSIVTEEAMARLFARGLDPVTGGALGRKYVSATAPADRVAARVRDLPKELTGEARQAAVDAITRIELARDVSPSIAGFDLTFTVMKSVSTVWALGDRAVQQSVMDAHRAAVDGAVAFLEQRALFTRTGAGGCRQEGTRGAVAAAFDHWDSRAGDPNLHTHVVLANKVQGADGAWRSVDSRALHHAIVAVSELYEALLVDEVARRLPVRWGWRGRGPRRSPAFELEGVADELMAAYSQRSTQIDEAMTAVVSRFAADHGRAPNRVEIVRLRQQVTRATRPAKQARSLSQLLERWRRRAEEVADESPEQITARVIRASLVRPMSRGDVSDAVVASLATHVLDGVRERRSTWTRWNVMAEALRATKPLIARTAADRRQIVDDVCDAALSLCVTLEAPALFPASGRYSRPDGSSVFDRPEEGTFTDAVILDAERELLAAAADTGAPTARVLAADTAVNGAPELAVDQRTAVQSLARSGHVVDVLVGPAGSGKTTTLAALRQVWEREHGHGAVMGLAPSATAAANLAGALGIACENTAKWLHETSGAGGEQRRALIDRLRADRSAGNLDRRRLRLLDTAIGGLVREERRWAIPTRGLVVVDEASLAGTLALRDLVRQVSASGGKLVLVGDDAQLSAVDAGGAFGLLAERTGGARLRSLWRFSQAWEASATLGLRAGDPRVIEEYDEAGRLHAGAAESMLEEAYTAWSADGAAGATAILLAPDATTVVALNTRAHNDRVQDGLVQADGITTKDGTTIGVGDRIVTRLNDRRLRWAGGFVRNGNLWDVRETRSDGSVVAIAANTRLARRGIVGIAGSDEARVVVLPRSYVSDHVDLAYATTTHRAQGITVDRAHVLAHAGVTRENLYVAMTRGRHANHLYLSLDPVDADCDDLPDRHAASDAREALTTILATRGAEQSAIATIAARQDEAASLRRLEPIARTLYADAVRGRQLRRLTALGIDERVLAQIEAAPVAGRLFIALDRICTIAPAPENVLARLVDGLSQSSPAEHLLARARSWLGLHVADQVELPTIESAEGLDPDGCELLERVEHLIDERVRALTASAIDAGPSWLDDLGPAPQAPDEIEQWLASIGARAAHDDRHVRREPAARPAGLAR